MLGGRVEVMSWPFAQQHLRGCICTTAHLQVPNSPRSSPCPCLVHHYDLSVLVSQTEVEHALRSSSRACHERKCLIRKMTAFKVILSVFKTVPGSEFNFLLEKSMHPGKICPKKCENFGQKKRALGANFWNTYPGNAATSY